MGLSAGHCVQRWLLLRLPSYIMSILAVILSRVGMINAGLSSMLTELPVLSQIRNVAE